MRWLIALLLFSCEPLIDKSDESFFISHHEIEADQKISATTITSLPKSLVEKKLWLVKDPTEYLAKKPKTIAYDLGEDGKLRSKKPLKNGQYGFYWQHHGQITLLYVFFVFRLEQWSKKITASDRSLILQFDGPISLDDESILVEGLSGDFIKDISVLHDQRTAIINFIEDLPLENTLVFAPSFKVWGVSSPGKLDFTIKSRGIKEPELFVSDSAVEFSHFNGPTELIMLDSGLYCHFEGSLYLSDLKSSTTYKYLLTKHEDGLQEAWGSFTTSEKSSMQILEIMLGKPSEEYIKIVAHEDFSLEGLRISVEGDENKICDLGEVSLTKNSELLIAGRDFIGSNVLHLGEPDICGGLWGKPKIIRIMRKDGSLLARFGGQKWPKKPGPIKPMGLEEPNKNCY